MAATVKPIDSVLSDLSISNLSELSTPQASPITHHQPRTSISPAPSYGSPTTRASKLQEAITAYDNEILTLQQRVDRDQEAIRHLLVTRSIAIKHEKELKRIDHEYKDQKERQKILERVENAGSSKGKGSVRSSKGVAKSWEVKGLKREKPGLVLYGKRVMAKKDGKKDEGEKQEHVRHLP